MPWQSNLRIVGKTNKNRSIMRHTSLLILISVILAIISVDVKAQGLVYTPFIPRQSSSFDIGGGSGVSGSSRSSSGYSRPSCQTELTRTMSTIMGITTKSLFVWNTQCGPTGLPASKWRSSGRGMVSVDNGRGF